MQLRPCIVIPGIQGSALQNFYPISPVTTWSTLTVAAEHFFAPDFKSLALDDSGQSDADEEVVSRPSQLLAVAYAPLVEGLRGRGAVPTYLFPYDWRVSISDSAQVLVRYVNRLLRKPMPTIPNWDKTFDFACHSMGGLVFRAFLAAWKNAEAIPPPVAQVAFIATPHLGSLEAAQALISGETPWFGGRKELRKLARTFPALYELLPRFPGAVIQGGNELDVFDERNWQWNTTSALPDRDGFDVRQRHLTAAKLTLTSLPQPTDGILAKDILVVYGSKQDSTLRAVEVLPDRDNWYDFDNARRGVGDDVVPVESARLDGVASVEMQDGDISYLFHPIERAMAAADLHAFLPALDEVHTIVGRFFGGDRGVDLLPRGIPDARFHPA